VVLAVVLGLLPMVVLGLVRGVAQVLLWKHKQHQSN